MNRKLANGYAGVWQNEAATKAWLAVYMEEIEAAQKAKEEADAADKANGIRYYLYRFPGGQKWKFRTYATAFFYTRFRQIMLFDFYELRCIGVDGKHRMSADLPLLIREIPVAVANVLLVPVMPFVRTFRVLRLVAWQIWDWNGTLEAAAKLPKPAPSVAIPVIEEPYRRRQYPVV